MIRAGVRAEVIGGLLGKDSPNIGLVVKVHACVGEHSTLGRVWRCCAEYAERGQPGRDVPGGLVDFAQQWLRPLPPAPAPAQAVKREAVA